MEQRPEQTQEITAEQLSELLQVRRDKLFDDKDMIDLCGKLFDQIDGERIHHTEL